MKAIPCARYVRYMALFAPNCKERPREPPNLSRKPELGPFARVYARLPASPPGAGHNAV